MELGSQAMKKAKGLRGRADGKERGTGSWKRGPEAGRAPVRRRQEGNLSHDSRVCRR
jgi:hypothetical protein